MKLSEKEKKIIALISARAKMSIKEIQQKTSYREHTIRYALTRLKKECIIYPISLADMYKVGYLEYTIYFSLRPASRKTREKIIEQFLQSDNVPWCVEMGGEYQYAAAFQATHIQHVVAFLNEVSEQFGNVFFRKSIHMRLFVNIYNWQYLDPSVQRTFITLGNAKPSVSIDDVDKKILIALQQDAWQSAQSIAQELQKPASTIANRIKKLEQTHVVSGYFLGINQHKINAHVAELFIYVKGVNPTLQERLHQFAMLCPHIIHFLQGVGEWDFEFGVAVEQQHQVREIIEELYQEFGEDIIMIKSFPIFRYLKSSMSIYARE